MDILIMVVVMIVVGLVVGALAGVIWKDNRPIGAQGDYIVAVITTVAVGLIDWFVIPAMGFSDIWKYLGVALEPPLLALFILWLIRRAKR
ncbi:MAG: hypothetical protein GTO14_20435 [Anaerolineales bacterium]|nr:hypothetical protein [Anaerolineales bacterium]